MNKIPQVLSSLLIVCLFQQLTAQQQFNNTEMKIDSLLSEMTLAEKIGQMTLCQSPESQNADAIETAIRLGEAGALLNETNPDRIRHYQQIAVNESRLGIPLLFGRDIIHGFKTVFPINIGLAASFNPTLAEETARIAALEATSVGVNWNFAPMVDISRDPRWGRMAEGFGEDTYLTTTLALSMLKGFQGESLSSPNSLAACAKHFAAYGAAEGGRDYNTTDVSEVELWNTYFPPFKALAEAGIATFMTGFNDLNGIPASGNSFLFQEVLKEKWNYNGFVVSDWASITEMITHGFAADDKDAALKAVNAGVDMEMATKAYAKHLKELLNQGKLDESQLDDAVKRILRVKFKLGLFERPFVDSSQIIQTPPQQHLLLAQKAAEQSMVLLKNKGQLLPLDSTTKRQIAVIGPMANDRYEQLGTWIFDGDTNLSITPLTAFREKYGNANIRYAKGLSNTRSNDTSAFSRAINQAKKVDIIFFFAGEESILTGEAHSRAFLDLPGAQSQLFQKLRQLGKPLVLVVMTSRPLAIGDIIDQADAVIYAWHPGTMAGPALANIVSGAVVPSAKLPVTFPKTAGQIPVYYNHKMTGRPPSAESFIPMEEIPARSFQTSLGNTSHYMDIGFEPLFPFGYGLSYSSFEYKNIQLSVTEISKSDSLEISFTLRNTGDYAATEIAQLYVRDLVASITRPVKELKGFQRITLNPGESREIIFMLKANDLGFYDKDGNYQTEAGKFLVGVGGNSAINLSLQFLLK